MSRRVPHIVPIYFPIQLHMEKSNLNFYLIVTAGRFVNIYDYMKMSIFLYLNYHPINIILIRYRTKIKNCSGFMKVD
jgi:uncharacterized protein YybS (DUF2232 family)